MNRKLPVFVYYLFLVIFLELVFKWYTLGNLFSKSSFLVILFSIPNVFMFTILSSSFSEKVNKIIFVLISFVLILVFFSQIVYNVFYDSIFSIYSVINGTNQVFGDFFGEILRQIWENILVLLLIVVPITFLVVFSKKIFNFKRSKLNCVFSLVMFLLFFVINSLVVYLSDNGVYSLKRLYTLVHAPIQTYNKVGLINTTLIDINRFIFGFEEKFYFEEALEEVVLENEVKYNMLDIDFESLISSESNETIRSMHEYFNSVVPSKENEYTGIFKGKNLIYITAEAFDTIGVSESVTPTLYKLVNNGFVFSNYYQPLFGVSTSDGEYMFMNSLLPKSSVWSFYRSSNIYMPFGLGNVFKREGYSVLNAYHNHLYSYYDRNLSHINIGFNLFLACGNGLEKRMNCNRWPNSDLEMMEATVGDYINSEKFMVYYMTVSGHLNYRFTGNNMASRNRSVVENLPYSSRVKGYLATQVELDKALNYLLSSLESAGKLDDTVIVISPDHYPYGLTDDEINEVSSIDRSDKFNKHHTSLIIYNSEIEKVHVDKYTSSIDVLPTIYNLFGISYDSRLLIGRDALSDGEGLVIFSDRSFITDSGKYDAISGEFVPFVNNLSEDYVSSIISKVNDKFTISSLLLYEENGVYLDYYRKLGI